MIPALSNQQGITFNGIYQPVTTVYSARPETGQLMLELFGFTDAGKRFTQNVPNQIVYALEHRLVCRLPIEIVFPCCC